MRSLRSFSIRCSDSFCLFGVMFSINFVVFVRLSVCCFVIYGLILLILFVFSFFSFCHLFSLTLSLPMGHIWPIRDI